MPHRCFGNPVFFWEYAKTFLTRQNNFALVTEFHLLNRVQKGLCIPKIKFDWEFNSYLMSIVVTHFRLGTNVVLG